MSKIERVLLLDRKARELLAEEVGCDVEDLEVAFIQRDDALRAIARALEQPASAAGVEGWFLPASSLNSLQRVSVDAQIRRCKAAHFTNLDIRINGQNEVHEADWVKHMVKAATTKPDAVAGLVEAIESVVREMDCDEKGKPYVYTQPSMVIWTEKWRGWVKRLRDAAALATQHQEPTT